jgi:anti-sigma regulatory factor (Ser/Thr protein kinase)
LIEIVIHNDYAEIVRVNRALEDLADQHALPVTLIPKLKTVIDEVLGNVIMHGYADQQVHEITTRIEFTENRLVVIITDDGVPFNPLDFPAPDIETGLEDRKIGGLGIHIVRNMMDDMSYQRRGDQNLLTLIKELKVTDPGNEQTDT